MILLTQEIRTRLLANGRSEAETDHLPVIKLFNPCGAATWLATELDGDNDTLFGLADPGFGFPELGYFSLSEISSISLPFGLTIERDLYFCPRFSLAVYAQAACSAGGIVEADALLCAAALSLGLNPDPEIPPIGG